MLDVALGVWTHMEETLGSGVFDAFIACGKKIKSIQLTVITAIQLNQCM